MCIFDLVNTVKWLLFATVLFLRSSTGQTFYEYNKMSQLCLLNAFYTFRSGKYSGLANRTPRPGIWYRNFESKMPCTNKRWFTVPCLSRTAPHKMYGSLTVTYLKVFPTWVWGNKGFYPGNQSTNQKCGQENVLNHGCDVQNIWKTVCDLPENPAIFPTWVWGNSGFHPGCHALINGS